MITTDGQNKSAWPEDLTAAPSNLILPQELKRWTNEQMPFRLIPTGNQTENVDEFLKRRLAELREPGALQTELRRLDEIRKFRRIFVMGCGRSGTWLLLSLFATFVDADIVPKELDVAEFGTLGTDKSVLVFKRTDKSYFTALDVPPQVEIVYIVRHPFDVLTSKNKAAQSWRHGKYHISVERWVGEMNALRHLLTVGRPGTLLVKYEDLVSQPDAEQQRLARELNLKISHPVDDIPSVFNAPIEARLAMHGVRKIDVNSLHRYRNDPEKVKYLKTIVPDLGPMLNWTAQTFDYDVSLPS